MGKHQITPGMYLLYTLTLKKADQQSHLGPADFLSKDAQHTRIIRLILLKCLALLYAAFAKRNKCCYSQNAR